MIKMINKKAVMEEFMEKVLWILAAIIVIVGGYFLIKTLTS